MNASLPPSTRATFDASDRLVALALALPLLALPFLGLTDQPVVAFLVVPVVLWALVGLWILVQHPLANLAIVLAASVFTIGFKAGIQAEEVLYGVYYALYLFFWFALRLGDRNARLVRGATDAVLLTFLALVLGLTPVWFAFGADLADYLSAVTALLMLAFYFPVVEAILRHRHGLTVILGIALGIPVYVALRNLINYREVVAMTVVSEFLANRRVAVNDTVLMLGAVLGTALFATVRKGWPVALTGAATLVCAAALVITQSRTMWVILVLGGGLSLLLSGTRGRTRLLIALACLIAAGLGAASMLLSGNSLIILDAWSRRLTTLRTAVSSDISFLSRLYEARGALEYVRQNPVLGYGLGVSYTYFDILDQATVTKSFLHNGYVGLVYRYGIWGSVAVLWVWGSSIIRGFQAFRRGRERDPLASAGGFGAALVLCGLTISSITANPFYTSDGFLCFALMCALAQGCFHRIHHSDAHPVSPAIVEINSATLT